MIVVAPDDNGFAKAVDALRSGEVVAHPTETVYGLAVNPFSHAALKRLWDLKDRDPNHPVLLIVDDPAQLDAIVAEVSPRARRCIERFWPGPLTLLLPKTDSVPVELTGGRLKVAVRQPAHPVARRLCAQAATPLTSTSANRSGLPPARDPAAIRLPGVAVCLDGGVLPPSLASTIYDPDEDVVVRDGAVPAEALRICCG